jgi:hypothetical protein
LTPGHLWNPGAVEVIAELIHIPSGKYVRCSANSGMVAQEQHVLDLLAYCGETQADGILFDEEHLHHDFFDLKTGLAGAVFLKLTTYRVRTAVVATWRDKDERFREMVYEINRGDQIHFFTDLAPAERWLTS